MNRETIREIAKNYLLADAQLKEAKKTDEEVTNYVLSIGNYKHVGNMQGREVTPFNYMLLPDVEVQKIEYDKFNILLKYYPNLKRGCYCWGDFFKEFNIIEKMLFDAAIQYFTEVLKGELSQEEKANMWHDSKANKAVIELALLL